MDKKNHTVVFGAVCLGCASAVSIARKLGTGSNVCLVEKAEVDAGLSSLQSGLVRAANAVPKASRLAKRSLLNWKDLSTHWGVEIPYKEPGALWEHSINHVLSITAIQLFAKIPLKPSQIIRPEKKTATSIKQPTASDLAYN